MCRKNQRTIIKYSIMAGKVVILSAPSGCGKTTLARHLLSEDMYYGTLKSEVNNLIVNHNIVFDVDVIGALSLKKYFKSLSISIFIKPPSIDILEKRLIDREKNDPSEIKERVGKAEIEMKKEADFDSVIINEDLDVAKQELIDKVERFLK